MYNEKLIRSLVVSVLMRNSLLPLLFYWAFLCDGFTLIYESSIKVSNNAAEYQMKPELKY